MLKTSLLILTYKRPQDVLELLEGLSVQKDFEALEIIVIDNDPNSVLETIIREIHPQVIYDKQRVNKGVPGGRNAAVRLSTGDILVFIDDDAVFDSEDVFATIGNIFKYNHDVGCIAFRIRNKYSRTTLIREFPHPDLKTVNQRKYVGYFIGAGHAIRREVFEKVGLYPEAFIYGFEELDLSYRMIASGYKILYEPDIKIIHKTSPDGRVPQKTVIRHYIRNRLSISMLYLPMPYRLTSIFFWTILLFKNAVQVKSVENWFYGLLDVFNGFPYSKKTITPQAIKYLKETKGRLWY